MDAQDYGKHGFCGQGCWRSTKSISTSRRTSIFLSVCSFFSLSCPIHHLVEQCLLCLVNVASIQIRASNDMEIIFSEKDFRGENNSMTRERSNKKESKWEGQKGTKEKKNKTKENKDGL